MIKLLHFITVMLENPRSQGDIKIQNPNTNCSQFEIIVTFYLFGSSRVKNPGKMPLNPASPEKAVPASAGTALNCLQRTKCLSPERLCSRSMTIAAQKLANAIRIGLEGQLVYFGAALGTSPITRATVGVSRLVHHSLFARLIVVIHYFIFFSLDLFE